MQDAAGLIGSEWQYQSNEALTWLHEPLNQYLRMVTEPAIAGFS
ncbi:MAG: hypothetical protein ACXWKC_06325 [Xanthobacteraceae bacterium]